MGRRMTKTMIRTKFGKAELKATYGPDRKPIVKDGLKIFAQHLKKRLAEDQQNVIVIDGHTGTGKSNGGVDLALEMDKKWNIEASYVFNDEDFSEKLDKLNGPNPILFMDEGSVLLNSKNALCRTDKEIIEIFDTMRWKHITTIVCCPNAMRLNKTFLADHIDYRLICPTVAPLPGYDARGFIHFHGHWSATWSDKQSWPFIYTSVFPKMPKAYQLRYDQLKRGSGEKIIKRVCKR